MGENWGKQSQHCPQALAIHWPVSTQSDRSRVLSASSVQSEPQRGHPSKFFGRSKARFLKVVEVTHMYMSYMCVGMYTCIAGLLTCYELFFVRLFYFYVESIILYEVRNSDTDMEAWIGYRGTSVSSVAGVFRTNGEGVSISFIPGGGFGVGIIGG